MAEKDASARLRRAVRGASACRLPSRLTSLTCGFAENNLFLVKRLIKRTDIRNPDPYNKRYTSLAWAAVLGHEETFEFLLSSGHDDHEYSKVSALVLSAAVASANPQVFVLHLGLGKQHYPHSPCRRATAPISPPRQRAFRAGFPRRHSPNGPDVHRPLP